MISLVSLPTYSIPVSGLLPNNFINVQAFGNSFFKEFVEANTTSAHGSFILLLGNILDQKHAQACFNVEQLADAMAICPRTLYRKTVSFLAINPNRLLRLYRLHKAVTLLQQGSLVADTAIAVGFENLSYFSKCFREEFHEHPSYYRNRVFIRPNSTK